MRQVMRAGARGFRSLVDQVLVDPVGEGGVEVVGLEGCGGHVGGDSEHPVELATVRWFQTAATSAAGASSTPQGDP